MITEEEKQEIIDLAVQKAMLMLPEVVGNLMAQHAALSKLNSKFYADHPEFKEHKPVVASVIEKVEGSNPLIKYEDLLAKAVPEIKKRLLTIKDLKLTEAHPPLNRNFAIGNGEV